MPVFSALMSAAFEADPFAELVRNDRTTKDENVRVLPVWVAEALEMSLRVPRQIAR